jgi:hypothetical protein
MPTMAPGLSVRFLASTGRKPSTSQIPTFCQNERRGVGQLQFRDQSETGDQKDQKANAVIHGSRPRIAVRREKTADPHEDEDDTDEMKDVIGSGGHDRMIPLPANFSRYVYQATKSVHPAAWQHGMSKFYAQAEST